MNPVQTFSKETLYSEAGTELLIEVGLIQSTGIKIQEIFQQTANTCLVKQTQMVIT